MRGSSSLLAAADAVFTATKISPGVSTFENTEMKEAETADPLVFELKKMGDSAVAVVNEHLTPTPSGVPSTPKGEIEILLMETLESMMPTGRPPVPPRGAMVPLPADVVTAGIATNGVLIAALRETFVMRRSGTNRAMKVQAFGRGIKSLQSKRLILVAVNGSAPCLSAPPREAGNERHEPLHADRCRPGYRYAACKAVVPVDPPVPQP